MTIKRISLFLASLAVMATGAANIYAADHHGDRGHRRGPDAMHGDPARMVERLTRRLDLDEAQQAAVDNIMAAVKPEADALRERGEANREAMRDLDPADADYSATLNNLALESGQIVTDSALLMGRVRAEIFAVLTDEQIAELESMRERWQDRGEKRRRQ